MIDLLKTNFPMEEAPNTSVHFVKEALTHFAILNKYLKKKKMAGCCFL